MHFKKPFFLFFYLFRVKTSDWVVSNVSRVRLYTFVNSAIVNKFKSFQKEMIYSISKK